MLTIQIPVLASYIPISFLFYLVEKDAIFQKTGEEEIKAEPNPNPKVCLLCIMMCFTVCIKVSFGEFKANYGWPGFARMVTSLPPTLAHL